MVSTAFLSSSDFDHILHLPKDKQLEHFIKMVGYKADGSASPQERQHSPSPDPTTAATHAALKPNPSGPSRGGPPRDSSGVPFKRAKLTQSDLQRIHVSLIFTTIIVGM